MKKYLGFTLIEVMVVMVIIAVLATAGISSYAWYVKESVSIKNDAYAQHVNGAIMQFRSDHNGRAPQNDAELADYLAMSTAPSHSILSSLTLFPTVFAATISMLPSNVLDAGYPARGRNDCVTDDGSFVQCAIAALFFSNGDHIIIYGQLTRKRITNYHTYTINGMSISGASIGKSGLIASTTAEITTQSVTDYGAGLGLSGLSISHVLASSSLFPETPSTTGIPDPTNNNPLTNSPNNSTPPQDGGGTPPPPPPGTNNPGDTSNPWTTYPPSGTSGPDTTTNPGTTYAPPGTNNPGITNNPGETSNPWTTYPPSSTTGSYVLTNESCFWNSQCNSAPSGTSPVCVRENWYDIFGICSYIASEVVADFAPTTYNPYTQPYGLACSGIDTNECRLDEYCAFGILQYFQSFFDWVGSLFGGDRVKRGQCRPLNVPLTTSPGGTTPGSTTFTPSPTTSPGTTSPGTTSG